MSVASDSKAARVASWRSCEIAALREGAVRESAVDGAGDQAGLAVGAGSNEMPPGVIAACAGAASTSRPRAP